MHFIVLVNSWGVLDASRTPTFGRMSSRAKALEAGLEHAEGKNLSHLTLKIFSSHRSSWQECEFVQSVFPAITQGLEIGRIGTNPDDSQNGGMMNLRPTHWCAIILLSL